MMFAVMVSGVGFRNRLPSAKLGPSCVLLLVLVLVLLLAVLDVPLIKCQEEPKGKSINMTAEELSRISLGNRCLDATCYLLRLAFKLGIPMCVENPNEQLYLVGPSIQ